LLSEDIGLSDFFGKTEILMWAGEYRNSMDRADAIGLLKKHVHEDSLLKHCYATGAIM
jgi:predicted hydrolase (HD superfamily)